MSRRPIVETEYTPRIEDGLTGLATLRHLLAQLDAMLREDTGPLALVRINVDRMKALNDAHGHDAGDAFLRELALRLRAHAPAGALVARVAGDDFAVVLTGGEVAAARALASELRARVAARAFLIGDRYVRPDLSVGVATGPRTAQALLQAAAEDLASFRGRTSGTDDACAWASGLWTPETARTVDAAAGVRAGLFVVADGVGGHCTGWIGARFAVRVLLDRLAPGGDPCLVGAADVIPDEWGWAGAMQSRADGEAVYADCAAELGDLAALPTELSAMFSAIDRVLAVVPPRARISGLMVSCTAVTIVDGRVVGAHAGMGGLRILRSGAGAFEDLVVPHYMHAIKERMPSLHGVDPASIPENVLMNGLGSLSTSGIGIDVVEAELRPRDVLLVSSRPVGLTDGELAEILRVADARDSPAGPPDRPPRGPSGSPAGPLLGATGSPDGPLRGAARAIEQRLAARAAAADYLTRPGEIAFVLVRVHDERPARAESPS